MLNEKQFNAERDGILANIRELNKQIAAPRDRDIVLPLTGGSEVVSIRARLRRAEKDLLETDKFNGKDKKRVRVPWNLCVGILDGLERSRVDGPIKEAVAFIEKFTRFKVNLTVIEDKRAHDYFSWMTPGGEVWDMLRDQLPPTRPPVAGQTLLMDTMPVAHSYLFLFKMFGRVPGRGGSTMGVSEGILKGGIRRPYSTITADVAQFGYQPFEGFTTQAAQIITHELANAINCVTAVAPYNCTPMRLDNPDNLRSYDYEARKVGTLTDADYAKLLSDKTW